MALVNQSTFVKRLLLKMWNIWPPFLGAGIRLTKVSDDLRSVEVTLKLRFWNRNFFGTQYGGSLFSMTDAMYSVMLVENLGKDFIVWDRAATIRYLKPGKTDVKAQFTVEQEDIDEILHELSNKEKMDWVKTVQITDLSGQVIAEVDKVVYIRRKKREGPSVSN